MSQGKQSRPVAVVTGATGMLGQATALALAKRGVSVILLARDPGRGLQVLNAVKQGASQRCYLSPTVKVIHRQVGALPEPMLRDIVTQFLEVVQQAEPK